MNLNRQPTQHCPGRPAPPTIHHTNPVSNLVASPHPVRRTMQLFCLLLVLLTAAPVWGGEFYLNNLGFDDPPAPGMICTKGACSGSASGLTPLPISSYAFPRDWTHFEGTPITTPHYDFLNDQLFRIRFQLDCRSALAGECIAQFWRAFNQRYPVTENPCSSKLKGAVCRRGALASGEILSISWRPQAALDSRPIVQIFDPYLMDRARSLANPNYQPRIE